MSFRWEPADIKSIIEKPNMLHFASRQCQICNWTDHEANFVECHSGSGLWVCKDCTDTANERNSNLCTPSCKDSSSIKRETSIKPSVEKS